MPEKTIPPNRPAQAQSTNPKRKFRADHAPRYCEVATSRFLRRKWASVANAVLSKTVDQEIAVLAANAAVDEHLRITAYLPPNVATDKSDDGGEWGVRPWELPL